MQYLLALADGLSRHDDLQVSVFYEDPRSVPSGLATSSVAWVALPTGESRVTGAIRAASTMQIRRIWNDEALDETLVRRGTKRMEKLSLDHFGNRCRDVVVEVAALGESQ